MRVKLLNAAVMPHAGYYVLHQIERAEFLRLLQESFEAQTLDSYVGYPQNIDLLREWSGLEIPLNRGISKFKNGDKLLVMRLRYRPPAESKGRPVSEEDFEFFEGQYWEEEGLQALPLDALLHRIDGAMAHIREKEGQAENQLPNGVGRPLPEEEEEFLASTWNQAARDAGLPALQAEARRRFRALEALREGVQR